MHLSHTVSGSLDDKRAVMEAYLDALVSGGNYQVHLAEGVTFTMTETGEVTRGRAAVVGLIDYLHQQAFAASPVIASLIVDVGHAAIEAEFVAVHTGEFAGIPASGREVRVPYAVAYDVTGDTITAMRSYLPLDVLLRQLRDT